MKRICLNCSRQYYDGRSENKYTNPNYCSYQCQKEGEWKKEFDISLPLNIEQKAIKDFGIENAWIRSKAAEPGGCRCPLCKQHVQIYAYTISKSMAHALAIIYRHFHRYPDSKPIHVDSYLSIFGKNRPKGNKHGLLCFWGLLERTENGRRGAGYYRITEKGKKFVMGLIGCEKYAMIYNGQCYEMTGPEVTFAHAIKEPFNLDEFLRTDISKMQTLQIA